jgi:hypothetical protein
VDIGPLFKHWLQTSRENDVHILGFSS